MSFKDKVKAILLYLTITPVDAPSARALYTTYLRAVTEPLLRPARFVTVGQFLARDILVKCRGLLVFARAHSEDLGYYAHITKPHTFTWFTPTRGDIVVDCGSSVGLFTLLALQAGARVFAFEPNPSTFAVLRHNVALNRFTGATLINMGLGERKGELLLHAHRFLTGTASYAKGWSDWVSQYDEEIEVPTEVTTLDAELINPSHIHWLLIDVEGFEFQVLIGAKSLLKKVDRVIIEVSHGSRKGVLELLRLAGFSEKDRGSFEKATQYFLFEKSVSQKTVSTADQATNV